MAARCPRHLDGGADGIDCAYRVEWRADDVLYVALRGPEEVVRSGDAVWVAEMVLRDMEQQQAERSPDFVFVHAGVVGTAAGAVVFPGDSGAGKTSVVLGLIKAGATYFSDEFAVLDDEARVHPFTRRLGVRGEQTAPATLVPAESLGAEVATGPAPAGAVLLLRFEPGATGLRVDRLSEGEALLAVLEHTVPARLNPQRSLAALGPLASAVPVWKGVRGEIESCLDELLDPGSFLYEL